MESPQCVHDDTFDSLVSDSGYSSSPNTLEKAPNIESTPRPADNDHEPRTNPIGELLGLNRFEKNVDEVVLNQFMDLTERLLDPLIQYLRKWRRSYRPLAMRLMVLGDTYENAQPQIVVFCPSASSKRVKKFFRKSNVVSICRPAHPAQTELKVHIIGHTLSPTSSDEFVEVFGSLEDIKKYGVSNTGVLISIQCQGESHFAVMGGIISVQKQDNTSAIYGLTVGHGLEYMGKNSSIETDGLLLEDIPGLEETSESDDISDEDYDDGLPSNTIITDPIAAVFSHVKHDWKKVGKMKSAPRCNRALNRDWALVENIERSSFQSSSPSLNPHTLKEPMDTQSSTLNANMCIEVFVLSGASPQVGTLSALPAVALLSSGTSFVNVFTLQMADNNRITPGSSGAWVINRHTHELYGHVVAADPFGDVFVVPMWDIFDDIKQEYNALKVTIVPPSEFLATTQVRPLRRSTRRKQTFEPSQPKKRLHTLRHTKKDRQEEGRIGNTGNPESVGSVSKSEPWDGLRSSSWSTKEDETLITARAQGLNWNQIAPKHFPSKSSNACRKRHERLMERQNAEKWDGVKLDILAQAYMDARREMWDILASRVGERWQVVEQKCMETGLKNLNQANRSAQKRNISDCNDSGIGRSSPDMDDEHDDRMPDLPESFTSYQPAPYTQQRVPSIQNMLAQYPGPLAAHSLHPEAHVRHIPTAGPFGALHHPAPPQYPGPLAAHSLHPEANLRQIPTAGPFGVLHHPAPAE